MSHPDSLDPTEFSAALKEARLEMNKFYQILPINQLEDPNLPTGWSVKDLLGILAAWDRYVVEHLAAETTATLDKRAVDDWEYNTYKERADWSWGEIEEESQDAFHALLKAVGELAPARLNEAAVRQFIEQNTLHRYQKYGPVLERYAKQYRNQRRR
jgi:hypothetical protein